METREDILKELKETAATLALMEKKNPYQVPAGYFEAFGEKMLAKVLQLNLETISNPANEELKMVAPVLAGVHKGHAVEIPADYFGDFSAQLLKKIRANEVAQELSNVAPALSLLEKTNAFKVPANYFNALPGRILNLVAIDAKAKAKESAPAWWETLNIAVDQISNLVFKPKYSVAFAGFATLVLVSVMTFQKVEQCNDLECRFAQLTNDEINNYLDNKSDAYSDEVFEMNVDDKAAQAAGKESGVHIYKDALKEVDDAALNDAIND